MNNYKKTLLILLMLAIISMPFCLGACSQNESSKKIHDPIVITASDTSKSESKSESSLQTELSSEPASESESANENSSCLSNEEISSNSNILSGTSFLLTSAEANGTTVNQSDYEKQIGGKSMIYFETSSKYTMIAGTDKSSDKYTFDGKNLVIYEGNKKYNGTYDTISEKMSLYVDSTTLNFEMQSQCSSDSNNDFQRYSKSDAAKIDSACKIFYAGIISGAINSQSSFAPSDAPKSSASQSERKAWADNKATILQALDYSGLGNFVDELSNFFADSDGNIHWMDDNSKIADDTKTAVIHSASGKLGDLYK